MPTQENLILIFPMQGIIDKNGMKSRYGKVSYRVLTNAGSGEALSEWNRDHHMYSVPIFTHSQERNRKIKTADEDALVPVKYINAKHGDIVLNAQDGDIILIGDNILMT